MNPSTKTAHNQKPSVSRSYIPTAQTLESSKRRPVSILLLGLCLTACPLPVGAQSKPTPPDALKAEKPATEPNPTYHFHGKIVDPNGKPAAGATVRFTLSESSELIPLTTANDNGIFDFSLSPKDAVYRSLTVVRGAFVAAADGGGPVLIPVYECETTGALAWLAERRRARLAPPQTPQSKPGETATFQLIPDDVPLTGRVVDIDGRPIEGAILHVTQLAQGGRDRLDAWEKAAREPQADDRRLQQLLGITVGDQMVEKSFDFIRPAVTDGKGRFTLKGIGRDRVVKLVISGPGIATGRAFARTRPGEIIEVSEYNRPGSNRIPYQPAAFTYVAAPSILVEGTVRDAKTKQPMPGVTLRRMPLASDPVRSPFQGDFIQTVTDAEGHYRFAGLPVGVNELLCLTALDQPYIVSSLRIKTQPGEPALTKDVELTRGIWIEGRAYDQRTGKPIRSGRVTYFPFADNPFAKAVQGYAGAYNYSGRFELNQDGTYRVPGLPGRGLVAARTYSYDGRYPRGMGADRIEGDVKRNLKLIKTYSHTIFASNFHVLKEVDPAEDAKSVRVDFPFDSGQSFKVNIVDRDGKPLSGGQYFGMTDFYHSWKQFQGHQVTINGYRPEKPRRVQVFHEDRKLAGVLLIDQENPRDLKITLQPWAEISGRLLDRTGVPLTEATLRDKGAATPADLKKAVLPPLPIRLLKQGKQVVTTDEDGRFKIAGLVPGKSVDCRVYKTSKNGQLYGLGEISWDASLKPGESRDLGDVQLKR